MKYKSVILPSAKKDIREAAGWYEYRQKGLGKRFTAMVRQKMRLICDNPKAYTVRYSITQTALLKVFPYLVHFIADHDERSIVVIAVLHTRQSPKNWTRADT